MRALSLLLGQSRLRHLRLRLLFLLVLLFILIVCSVYHFRVDIFGSDNEKFYILESLSMSTRGEEKKHQTVLIEVVPQLMSNRKRSIEKLFWEHVSLDTLVRYKYYAVGVYRKTKYLTKDFIVGGTYPTPFDGIDETMSWRNHVDDRVAWITIPVRDDGRVYYCLTIYDSGYGFNILTDIEDNQDWVESYESVEQLYHTKKKELGL